MQVEDVWCRKVFEAKVLTIRLKVQHRDLRQYYIDKVKKNNLLGVFYLFYLNIKIPLQIVGGVESQD